MLPSGSNFWKYSSTIFYTNFWSADYMAIILLKNATTRFHRANCDHVLANIQKQFALLSVPTPESQRSFDHL